MKDMTKRAILLALVLAVLVACVGCGGGVTPTPANDGDTEPAQTSDDAETPDSSQTEEQSVTPDEPEPNKIEIPPDTTPDTANQIGLDASNAGEAEKALAYWEFAAAQGYAPSIYNLGVHYYYANHEEGLDAATAEEYWEKSRNYCEQVAATGHADALYTLGLLYT